MDINSRSFVIRIDQPPFCAMILLEEKKKPDETKFTKIYPIGFPYRTMPFISPLPSLQANYIAKADAHLSCVRKRREEKTIARQRHSPDDVP